MTEENSINLWEQIGTRCLKAALSALEKEEEVKDMYRELSREEERSIGAKIIKLLISESCTVRQAEGILGETARRIQNISPVQFPDDVPYWI